MRKYLRAIARYNMEKSGVRHINKKSSHKSKNKEDMLRIIKDESYFATSWKQYLNTEKVK